MELRKKKSVNLWFLSTAKHNLLTSKCNHCSWRKLVTDLTVKSEGKMTVCQYKCFSRVLFLGMCVCVCVSVVHVNKLGVDVCSVTPDLWAVSLPQIQVPPVENRSADVRCVV